jgi:hypothetical protein
MVSSREAARQLPEILRRRVPDEASDAEKQAAFNAVVAHYNLTEQYTAFMGAPNGSTLRAPAAAKFWCELAVKLMFDFNPAYHLGKPGRRRNTTGNAVDWIAAGGGVLGVPADLTAFYQAVRKHRFVGAEHHNVRARWPAVRCSWQRDANLHLRPGALSGGRSKSTPWCASCPTSN